MSSTRARLAIALVAAAHAALFIVYQRPDWDTQWTDQNGYMRLGHTLAGTGRFTRFPESPGFVPEAIRTPGYPMFLAAIERVSGRRSHLTIAAAQGGLFVTICLLVYGLGRIVANETRARAAALVTALFPPLPYFSALALTEILTTCLVTLGMLLWLRALRTGGRLLFAATGAVFAWTALTRPTFQYLPLFLVAAACWSERHERNSRWRRGAILMVATFVTILAPWLAYNAVYFRTLTFTPAGGVGRVLFEGTWQVELPGRIETGLTAIADATPDRQALDEKVRAFAAASRRDPEPMLQYVHQWQDIRRIWTEPQDPWERTLARIAADREYLRVGLENAARHPLRHLWRRGTRGFAILWFTEIPVRYSDINSLPPWSIRLLWLPQVVLLAAALWGLVVVWRSGCRTEALAGSALLLYITAVHTPLYSEARYSLPAKPMVLLAATIGVADLAARSRARAGDRRRTPGFGANVTIERRGRPFAFRRAFNWQDTLRAAIDLAHGDQLIA